MCGNCDRKKLKLFREACCLAGVASSGSAYNTWVGGQVLSAAGWAPIAVSHLPLAAGLGTLPIIYPLTLLMEKFTPACGLNLSFYQNGFLTLTLFNALFSYLGALGTQMSYANAGYAAAAGGVGSVVLLGAIACGNILLICCRTEERGTFYVSSVSPITASITQQQINAIIQNDGILYDNEIITTLQGHGLDAQANQFKEAHLELQNFHQIQQPQESQYPQSMQMH